jgi:hypothetical protein
LFAPFLATSDRTKTNLGLRPLPWRRRDCEICRGANLAGQNELYLLNQLHAFHTGKRVHKEMDYMARKLTEEEMEAIAAYFAALPPR